MILLSQNVKLTVLQLFYFTNINIFRFVPSHIRGESNGSWSSQWCTKRVIMAGLHQRLEVTNAKNLVGYPLKSSPRSRAPLHVFLLTGLIAIYIYN